MSRSVSGYFHLEFVDVCLWLWLVAIYLLLICHEKISSEGTCIYAFRSTKNSSGSKTGTPRIWKLCALIHGNCVHMDMV